MVLKVWKTALEFRILLAKLIAIAALKKLTVLVSLGTGLFFSTALASI
jgi:hypothetical protein